MLRPVGSNKCPLTLDLLVPVLLTNDTYTQRLNREFDEIAPWEFHYPREPKRVSRRISGALKHFYLKDQPASNRTEKGIGDVSPNLTFTPNSSGKRMLRLMSMTCRTK